MRTESGQVDNDQPHPRNQKKALAANSAHHEHELRAIQAEVQVSQAADRATNSSQDEKREIKTPGQAPTSYHRTA